MNKLLWICVLALLGYFAWQKRDEAVDLASKAATSLGLSLAKDGKVVSVAATEPPAPEPGIRLPEGAYMLKERFAFVTDGVPLTLEAGTQVRKVGDANGKILIESGRLRTVIDGSKLTRDPLEVAFILKKIDEFRNSRAALGQNEINVIDGKIAGLNAELKALEKKLQENKDPKSGVDMRSTNPDFIHSEINRLERRKTEILNQMPPSPPPPPTPAKGAAKI